MIGSALQAVVLAVCAFASLLLLPAAAAAAPHVDPGRIGGIVATPDHAPVADAQVALVHNGVIVARTTTDAEGRFRFDRIRPGAYVVRAAKRDVGQGRARVFVRSGQTVRVPIVLEP